MNRPALPSLWSPEHGETLKTLARKAGAAIRALGASGTVSVEHKPDASPVTIADRESQRLILEGLSILTPDIPVIAEEKDNPAALIGNDLCWLVDPLDGTRDFIAGGKMEYAVNIGLLVNKLPCLGVVYAPALDELFYGAPGRVEWQTPSGTKLFTPGSTPIFAHPPRLLTSRHEVSRLALQSWKESGIISGWRPCTSAFKFGLLAAGEAELYPRVGPTSEWDTAAGHAILHAVGGQVFTLDGTPLTYGKPGYRNGDFLACGPSFDPEGIHDFLGLIKKEIPFGR